MDSHPKEQKSAPSGAVPVKKAYQPPALLQWGSLRDITQNAGNKGKSDGGRRPWNRTR